MATRTLRPKVQNGPVQRRAAQPARRKSSSRTGAGKVAGRAKSASTRRGKTESRGDARVYWLLVIVAAVMATGFIYSLRTRINIHKLGQMESRLKDELDDIANRQRYEVMEQQRAINPVQNESAARQSGLIQPQLSGPRIAPAVSDQKPVKPKQPVKAENRRERRVKPEIRRVVKRGGQRR